MKNLKMILELDGSRYKGWQKQGDNDLTIQGKIEEVLSKMTEEKVQLSGCERCDVGVHAENYMANFHTNCKLSNEAMLDYLQEELPKDIAVKSLGEASEKFHAAYNIKSKTYVYKINNNELRDVFNRKYVYHTDIKLNLEEMRITSEALVGKHDFESFSTVTETARDTIKTINYINITDENGIIEIEINGDDFLWNMVRIVIGSLLEVGKGNLRPMDIEYLVKDKTASAYIPMAKTKGLSLRSVQY
jgi:tRNA pseudouridine38-40 synthase